MPDEEEGHDSSHGSIQTNQTFDQSEDQEQPQPTENGSLSSMQHLLPTERGGSIIAGTLEELDTGRVTVNGREYLLSSEEIHYRAVSRSVWFIGSSV
jgi:hypothetical protein